MVKKTTSVKQFWKTVRTFKQIRMIGNVFTIRIQRSLRDVCSTVLTAYYQNQKNEQKKTKKKNFFLILDQKVSFCYCMVDRVIFETTTCLP